MDAILRQSKAMCPFLKSASPAALRAMSTSTSAVRSKASPCGGTMSNLQRLAHRCPVMGKAMAIQSSKHGMAIGLRAISNQSKMSKANIHTSRKHEARTVESPVMQGRDQGMRPLHRFSERAVITKSSQ
jgi:5-aminolevulinate synthase